MFGRMFKRMFGNVWQDVWENVWEKVCECWGESFGMFGKMCLGCLRKCLGIIFVRMFLGMFVDV
jgi:hypothetical protein